MISLHVFKTPLINTNYHSLIEVRSLVNSVTLFLTCLAYLSHQMFLYALRLSVKFLAGRIYLLIYLINQSHLIKTET